MIPVWKLCALLLAFGALIESVPRPDSDIVTTEASLFQDAVSEDTATEVPATDVPATEIQSPVDHEPNVRIILMLLSRHINTLFTKEVYKEWAHIRNNSQVPHEDAENVVAHDSISIHYLYLRAVLPTIKDPDLRRQINKILETASSQKDVNELSLLSETMLMHQSNVKVCNYTDRAQCNIPLEPELSNIMESSRDPDELKHYWLEWFNKAGTPMHAHFNKYVVTVNAVANFTGFASNAELWLSTYEDETIEQQCDVVMEQLMPFYKQLHAYVRYELHKKYKDVVSKRGPIPAHLLGALWAEEWKTIANYTNPFPDSQTIDVTEEMVKQGYTPLKMFQMGDDFFQSLNMTKLPEAFWNHSILEKPEGSDIVCHPRAYDFFAVNDVRIVQCTQIKMDHLFVAYHELGHIQYFLQYQHLPFVYRTGANPGFHEAVGDVISLSVSSPKYLHKIGLAQKDTDDYEAKINKLYRIALAKIPALTFTYSFDKFRWAIFRNEINSTQYNSKLWEIRDKYSGIEPPEKRTEDDFDAPAKYHVAANIDFLRYFVSIIIQFQFHRALCVKAGEYVPNDPLKTLSNCDIYQSTEAGNAFKAMLSMGASKPWPDAMEVLTGTRKMDAEPLLEYFKPLYDFLVKRNEETGAHVGWDKSDKYDSFETENTVDT